MQSSSGSDRSPPYQGKELPCIGQDESRRLNQAQATPKTQDPEEPDAQEGIEASPIPNPAELRSEEETRGEGRQDGGRIKARKGLTQVATRGSRLQGTDGGIVPREEGLPPNAGPSSSKFSQGKAEKERGCRQDAEGTKICKSLARSFLKGSHAQATAVELVPQKKGPTNEPGPGALSERPTS